MSVSNIFDTAVWTDPWIAGRECKRRGSRHDSSTCGVLAYV